MKKLKLLMAFVLSAGLLSGCTGKFTPEETAVRIGKDGSVTAAIIDKLEQSYYNEDELEETVTQAVEKYNADTGEKTITVDTFKVEDRNVSLFMKYTTAKDYEAFNKVVFFVGDIVSAEQAGYLFDATFKRVEKGKITNESADKKEVVNENYNVLILEENMGVEVPGNIVFVSSNVEVTGRRKAKVGSVQPDTESKAETDTVTETEIEEIKPAEENGQETEGSKAAFAYIIYE